MTLSSDGKVKVPSWPMRTATIRMQAVVPIEKPRILKRPRMVPMAIASSRKISGAVEMIHLMVSMVACPPGAVRLVRSRSQEIGAGLDPDQPTKGNRDRLSVDAGFATPGAPDMSSL